MPTIEISIPDENKSHPTKDMSEYWDVIFPLNNTPDRVWQATFQAKRNMTKTEDRKHFEFQDNAIMLRCKINELEVESIYLYEDVVATNAAYQANIDKAKDDKKRNDELEDAGRKIIREIKARLKFA